MSITNVERARRKVLLKQGLKKCSLCSIVKSVDEFHTDNHHKFDRLYACCKECKSNSPSRIKANRHTYIRNNQKYKEYKKTLECINCGYNEDPTKLEFHHRDSTTKLFNVSHYASKRSFNETILKEIAKCDVMCKPCHAAEHHGT